MNLRPLAFGARAERWAEIDGEERDDHAGEDRHDDRQQAERQPAPSRRPWLLAPAIGSADSGERFVLLLRLVHNIRGRISILHCYSFEIHMCNSGKEI